MVTTSQTLYLGLLLAVALQRLAELALSRHNARWTLARGAVEAGREQLPWMKLLHTAFLLGCAAEVTLLPRPFLPALGLPMLALALAAQALRFWSVSALGPFWNVRILVVPGAPSVATGPYRLLRHPNYLAVALEGFAIPLVHSAWITAIVFSLANAVLLRARVRREEEALARHTDYAERFAGTPGLLPGRALRGSV